MTAAILHWIDAHARPLLWLVAAVAVVSRALLVLFSAHEFGYVWDFYQEGITFLYATGHLPESTACTQCYQPPLFFYVGLPFYALGRFFHPQSGWPHDTAMWAVGVVPLASGFACIYYTGRLLRLLNQRGAWLVFGTALAAAFPCLFIASFGLEADILLAALVSAFTYHLSWWFVHPGGRTWRAAIRLGILAGLAAATKFSGLVAPVAGMLVFAVAAWRSHHRAMIVRHALAAIIVAALVGSWKYVDNYRQYGTPMFANGSAALGFSLTRRSFKTPYDFTSVRLRELLALTRPDAPSGMLTVLPVYTSVWTTLHGLAWGDMGFFTNPTRHGTGIAFYADRHIAPWLASSVLVLGLVPDAAALIGLIVTLRRPPLWPVLIVCAVGALAYLAWILPQVWWAIKTKYLLMLLPGYVLSAVLGLRWTCRVMPAAISAPILASFIALIIAANVYLLSFAIG